MNLKKFFRSEAKDYATMLWGTCLYGLGIALFMLPYHLTTGGVGGISTIIFYLTGIEVQVMYALINCLFLVFAIKILGWRFVFKTIYGVALCTFWMWAWQRILESGTGELPRVCGNERFMATILGSMIEGYGLSVCFSSNGSTGGTDIIAACVNKYKDVSLGSVIFALDIVIISSCYFIFNDVQMVIFGYVMMAVAALTLDFCMRRNAQSVEFKIFSRNYAKIADAIRDANFGVTVIDGHGWYTKTERKVLICIVRKRHEVTIARLIKSVDPFAFVSTTNVTGVYGEGFDTMKTKVKGQKPILVFATNNKNKLREVREMLGNRFELRSLEEVGCHADIPETSGTLQGNALQKARFVKKFYGFDCFADDTGLEVDALGGAPGVFSARYANMPDPDYNDPEIDLSKDHDSQANMRKLLCKLDGKTERTARFKTVIALIQGDGETEKVNYFEGVVEGSITTEKHGTDGFGYDPVFQPEGYDVTFAEMNSEEKNKISHRGRAMEKLCEYLAEK